MKLQLNASDRDTAALTFAREAKLVHVVGNAPLDLTESKPDAEEDVFEGGELGVPYLRQ